MKTWIKELENMDFKRGKYSQSYQDALLEEIFEHLGTANSNPFCVEFGFNASSLTAGSGANVARMILDRKWDSLLMDGENENPKINLHKHFLTPNNVCDLFKQHGVPEEPEYISIDVDSTDLWLFEAVVKQYRAMVFSVEYNSHFPLHAAITFPNDPNEHFQGDRGYGASLKALAIVAESNGYSLLWVVPGLDAFFVRNDLIDDGTDEICFPFEKWAPCTSLICHKPLKNQQRLNLFLDYEVFCSSAGDIDASRTAAIPICKKFLLESIFSRAIRKAKRSVGKLRRLVKPLLSR
jgi:hypothetical protein